MKTVLFICVENSARSQMAEAFFNYYARGEATALSAGTQPGDALDAGAVKAMQEAGLDISGNKPKGLTDEMLDWADKVVSMGCGAQGVCPTAFVETQEWEIEDPKGKPLEKVRLIREQIRAKVLEMLARDGIAR